MLKTTSTSTRAKTRLFTVTLLLAACSAPLAIAANPPIDPTITADGPPLLREWHPPVYPVEALKARRSGMANVRLIVDETGACVAARGHDDSDEEFVPAAVAAVKTWVFSPALVDGKPAAMCVDTLVTFSPHRGQEKSSALHNPPEDQRFVPAPRQSPKPTITPEGGYPAILTERGLRGTVKFDCLVSVDGRALQPRVLAASHADFVIPALEALSRWEFTPGQQGDLTVPSSVDGVMTFESRLGRADLVLAANGITSPDGSAPIITPEPIVIVDPVWPFEALMNGESGSAVVEFTISERGTVSKVQLREATRPEFGQSAVAAVEMALFDRPIQNNQVVSVPLIQRMEFKAVPLDGAGEAGSIETLVRAVRRGEVGGAKGLDEKLTPLYRVRPEYPQTLAAAAAPAGRAELEFIIDREGRARLPKILSATHPEFGWAAATAVSQWVFKAPRRGGAAMDVKVRMPFEFAAPGK